jgi:hypothetical protein
MIDGYTTKEMKPTEMKEPKPSGMGKPEHMEDGMIFEKNGMFFFKWKGGECGYGSMVDAEAGLVKVSGNA